MTNSQFLGGAEWISRAVPESQRMIRATRRDRIDWAQPGAALAQAFRTAGPVTAVSLDVSGPRDAVDPHAVDVDYTFSLEAADGTVIAERRITGPQLIWEYFGQLLEITPPAPPGEYTVVLRSDREAIGWYAQDAAGDATDDGVSPRPVMGGALTDGEPVPGARLIAVDTTPAPNPIFRRTFEIDGLPERATLAATVLGCGHVIINGTRVGDAVLEPATTDYDKTVLYRVHEVGHLLRPGSNEIVIEAGRERWAARGGDIWGWNAAPWNREPTAVARLALAFADGRSEDIATGADWDAAPGPVRTELFLGGETWATGGAAPEWSPVAVVSAPGGELREATHAPMRAEAPMPPVVETDIGGGRAVYDFGAVMTGRLRCRVTGKAGALVRVTSGEQRDAQGAVVCDNILAAGNAQEDTLLLEGDVDDLTWEIQFSYRGFRWIQIDLGGDVAVEEVRAVPIYTPIDRIGEMSVDDPLLEWIDAATARTFRNNLHGIPTDTPIYEKNGWTADAHLATEALLHHFDLRPAFGKWLQDHRDAQGADGSIPHIIPTPGWSRASDPAWSSSAVLIPWYLYFEYGDPAVLEQNATMIRRYADNLIERSAGGIWRHRTWGDWLTPHYDMPPEGMAPLGTAMTVTALRHAAAVLDVLGEGDATAYRSEAATIADAYNAEYLDAEVGHYRIPGVGYRQTLNILPLAFGIVPPDRAAAVQQSLADDLEHRTDGHLDCGAVGIRHLLPVLSAAGRDDLALTVLLARTHPGWGVWFEAGETTLLEAWDASARSRNHYFLGSAASWIQQRVGGLRATTPGWRTFEIAPVDDPRVRGGRMRHRTPNGEAAVRWQRGPGGWRFEVEVPEGAEATIRVPGHTRHLAHGVQALTLASR
ncbi:family 78 glycoside hydrolase catalytic domain [Microbacterium sp. B2969]|uniref:alpha-L-rhamnosidase n=1 Tax=Microbacterium alkaliflavum TaxID=3248839 RepID=A0ABW7Q2G2_9MICO